MNFCASLLFNKDNYLTTGYSRNLLLAMSLVDCLNYRNSNYNLVTMFIFINVDNPPSDDESWSSLKDMISAWLKKLFYDAHFTKGIEFSFDDTKKTSGTITLGGKVIPIWFIYNNDLAGTNRTTTVENMISAIENTTAKLLLTTSNFPPIILNELRDALKILFVEGASARVDKTLPISSVSKISDILDQLKNDSEKYAMYSVGINDIFIKTLQAINDLASIKDLKTNNSFFELINTNPLEITSSGNNIKSSAQTIIPTLNKEIDKIKYLRTFATSLKNKGDKIIVKLNSIKINKQITEDSLNESIIKNFNETTSSWQNCEFVDRSVNVKETDKLYFILTDTTCKEIQKIQIDNETIYEYDLRLVFETDSIMRYMSKLVLLIVNYLEAYLPSK